MTISYSCQEQEKSGDLLFDQRHIYFERSLYREKIILDGVERDVHRLLSAICPFWNGLELLLSIFKNWDLKDRNSQIPNTKASIFMKWNTQANYGKYFGFVHFAIFLCVTLLCQNYIDRSMLWPLMPAAEYSNAQHWSQLNGSKIQLF